MSDSLPAKSVRQTSSTAATETEGEAYGRNARAGQVIGLSGELGAGKTAWVRGFARGIEYRGRVQSPSFGLIHEYLGGRLPMYHLDLYRLGSPLEVISAGLEVYLEQPDGVTIVEWPERWWPGFSTEASSRPGWSRVWLRNRGENIREIAYELPGA